MLALAVEAFSHLDSALIASLKAFVSYRHDGVFPIAFYQNGRCCVLLVRLVSHPAYLISFQMDIGPDVIHDSVVNSPRQ
jgi:hypothetical protein